MAEKGIRKDLLAKALSMYDPAAYRDHSVVSREVVNRPADTVTVFAFDAGEGLREQHTAPFDALVYSWKAGPRCISDGSVHQVNEGEMIIMPADRPHAVKATSRLKILLVMVR